MFVEAVDDMQNYFSGCDSGLMGSSRKSEAEGTNYQSHMISDSINNYGRNEKLQAISLEAASVLLRLIQSCAVAQSECIKVVSRLCNALPSDSLRVVENALCGTYITPAAFAGAFGHSSGASVKVAGNGTLGNSTGSDVSVNSSHHANPSSSLPNPPAAVALFPAAVAAVNTHPSVTSSTSSSTTPPQQFFSSVSQGVGVSPSHPAAIPAVSTSSSSWWGSWFDSGSSSQQNTFSDSQSSSLTTKPLPTRRVEEEILEAHIDSSMVVPTNGADRRKPPPPLSDLLTSAAAAVATSDNRAAVLNAKSTEQQVDVSLKKDGGLSNGSQHGKIVAESINYNGQVDGGVGPLNAQSFLLWLCSLEQRYFIFWLYYMFLVPGVSCAICDGN
jgi:hypothetical protein